MKLKSLVLAVAVVAVFALHWSYLHRGFYEDDFNFLVSADRGSYSAQLTSWRDLVGFWGPQRGWFYRPTYLTYFALVSLIFGPSPVVLHAGGLLLHAAVITMLGWLVWRLTRQAMVSVACAVAFLLWPGKHEAVWWIASHSTLLAALFSLASIHCWLSWRQESKRAYLWTSLLCFWFALCSKNDAASLPIAILCVDAWYSTSQGAAWREWLKSWRLRGMELAPFALTFMLYVGLEVTAARYYALYGDTGVQNFAHASAAMRAGIFARLLKKLSLGLVPLFPLGIATIVTVAAVALVVRRVTKDRPVWVFLLWGLVAAVPVPLLASAHAMSERFAYIPAMGMSCAVVLLAVAVGRETVKCRRVDGLHLFIMAVVLPVVAHYLRLEISDPSIGWMILFLSVATAGTLWRAGLLSGMLTALLMWVAMATQLEIYGTADLPYLLAGVPMVAALGWRSGGALMAAATALLMIVAWPTPAVSVPMIILCAVGFELWCRSQRESPRIIPATTAPATA